MRVNPNMVSDVVAAMQQTQAQEQIALQQLATGKRVNAASDDPAAAASMVENQQAQGEIDSYTQNVSSVLTMMQTIDSSLSSVVTAVNSAISLGVQGASSTTNNAQRQAIAQQASGIFSSVLATANLSYKGAYVFGGTDTDSPPYTADSSSSAGYVYNGNSGTNTVHVGRGYSIQSNLPGSQLFSQSGSDLLGSLNQLATALQSGTTTDVANATTQLRSAMDFVTQQRVFYSNGMSQLNAQDNFLSQETVNLKSQENTLVGADVTESVTKLMQAQTANNAVMAAAAKVLPGTLLDYLK